MVCIFLWCLLGWRKKSMHILGATSAEKILPSLGRGLLKGAFFERQHTLIANSPRV